MYFWRLDPLKQELRRGPLPATEVVKYTAWSGAALVLLTYVPLGGEDLSVVDGVLALLTAAITVGGILLVYRRNGGPAGSDFAARYLALGWVVGIRVLVVGLAALLVAFLLTMIATVVSTALTNRELPERWFDATYIGFTMALYPWYYLQFAVHMRDVAEGAVSQIPGTSPASI